jgi:hypothetical protein
MEVSGQLHAPAALSPVKETAVPIAYKARLAPEPVWTVEYVKLGINVGLHMFHFYN